MLTYTYVEGIGTVRECLDCGCLVAGGPTRCIHCANISSRWWRRMLSRLIFGKPFVWREDAKYL